MYIYAQQLHVILGGVVDNNFINLDPEFLFGTLFVLNS